MAIPFNSERAKEFSSQPQIAEGKHAVCVLAAERHRSDKNDNLMAKVTVQKMSVPGDPDTLIGPKGNFWMTFPLDNPEVEGHEAPQWSARMFADIAAAFSEALDEVPDIPYMPRYDKDAKATYYQGEILETKEDQDKAKIAVINAAGEWASELWGDDGDDFSQLIGAVLYTDVRYKNGSDRPNFDNLHGVCPDDWELTDQVVATFEGGDEEEEEEKAPKAAPKKKATRKKKARK